MAEPKLLTYRDATAWSDNLRGSMVLPNGSEWPRYRWVENHVHKADRVLDIGCNSGQIIRNLQASERKPRLNCYGVDIDPSHIKFCKSRDKGRVPRFFVCAGEYVDTVFPAKHFDTVLALEVIEHVKHLRPFLSAIMHVLRPGGQLLVTTPMPHTIIGYPYMQKYPQHRRVFNMVRMRVVMESAGFEFSTLEAVEKIGHGNIYMCGAFKRPIWASERGEERR